MERRWAQSRSRSSALVGIPERGGRATLLQSAQAASEEPRAEPQEMAEAVAVEPARRRGDARAQRHEPAVALHRLAEEDLLAGEVALVEAAGLVEHLARAVDEAARGPSGGAEQGNKGG